MSFALRQDIGKRCKIYTLSLYTVPAIFESFMWEKTRAFKSFGVGPLKVYIVVTQ